ncbi:MAG: DUF92 domain-containing protein [Spirochaetaceae bacterium]|nr:MAG: DUF92 domain-containing protein [Spirochaetaceae bacterium]
MNEWIGLLISYLFIFGLIGIAQALLRAGVIGASGTRKIVHIGVAHWWIIAMLWIESLAVALIGPLSFIIINWWSWRAHLFAAMEHEEHRKNLGTIWFPLALTGLVLLTWGGLFPRWYGLVAILVLGWGDGLASVVGERLGARPGAGRFRVPGGTKSVAGTAAAFLATGVVTALLVWLFTGPLVSGSAVSGPLAGSAGSARGAVGTAGAAGMIGSFPGMLWRGFLGFLQSAGERTWVGQPTDHTVLLALSRLDSFARLVAEQTGTQLLDPARWAIAPTGILAVALVVAAVATAAELLTPWGIDNITIPVVVILVVAALLSMPPEWVVRLAWAVGLNVLVASLAYLRRSVTGGGAITGALLGFLIFLSGGGFYWSILMAFFFSSSALGRIKSSRRAVAEAITEKGGRRDTVQVLANGGLAAAMAVAHGLTGSPVFMFGFAIALAAATADTWASEIGVLSRREPLSILTMRPVPRGTSGGISLLGLTAAAGGALFIGLWFAAGYGIAAARTPPAGGAESWNILETVILVAMITFGGFLGSLVDSVLGATVQAQYWDGLREAVTERRIDARGELNRLTRGWPGINNDAVNALSGIISTVVLVLVISG